MPQSPNEKQIRMMHIVNLMSIAYADGTITEDENNVLVKIAQDLGLTEEEFNMCIEHWKNTAEEELPIAVPETDDEQVAYMKHFALVMMVDGEIDEKEREFLARIADTYGYDPEKVVQMLIDDVYQEYFAEEEEDPLFEDTDDESQLEMGKMKLEWKNVEDAFDELFLPALRNEDACNYFMIIPNTSTRLFRLSPEQIELVQKAADKGYPLAWYVLGRYHQVVKPEKDSIDKAAEYLEQAADAGIPDARWALTMLYLYGYMGPVDMDKYNDLLDKAFDGGSLQAYKQKLHNMIQGVCNYRRDPKAAIQIIESFLEKDEEYGAIYPDLYALLGDAYRTVGNKDKADKCYEKAQDLGFFEAGARRFQNRVEGPDKDFYRETLSVILDFACDEKDPESLLVRALEHAYHYDKEEKEEKKASWLQKLRDDLNAAVELGNGDAAYYLSQYYSTGSYGFDKDEKEAEKWFIKASQLDSPLARAGEVEGEVDDEAEIPTVIIVNAEGKATVIRQEKEEWYKLAALIGAKRIAPVRVDALDKLAAKAGFSDHLVAWVDIDAPRKGLPENSLARTFYPGLIAGDIVFSLADNIWDPMPFYGVGEAMTAVDALKAQLDAVVTDLDGIEEMRVKPADYSKLNPFVDKGFVARIEPDGKAYIVDNSLAVFALVEEEIYDPARLDKLYELGKELGLDGRLTLWTENSALRKQMVMDEKITPNPIAAKFCPGPVADNIFVALEDDEYRIKLFEDKAVLKKVCLALGAKL